MRHRPTRTVCKNTRKRPPDIQVRLKAHLHAQQEALTWATRAVAHREAGRHARAAAAESRCKNWLRRARALEPS
jgi:hypothetical protein